MKKMKKTLLVVMVTVIVFSVFGGTALACGRGRRGYGGGYGPGGGYGTCEGYGPGTGGGYGMMRGMHHMNAAPMPEAVRDKLTEAAKINVDLRSEMAKNPVDRAKVEELWSKRCSLMQEVHSWHLQYQLDFRQGVSAPK